MNKSTCIYKLRSNKYDVNVEKYIDPIYLQNKLYLDENQLNVIYSNFRKDYDEFSIKNYKKYTFRYKNNVYIFHKIIKKSEYCNVILYRNYDDEWSSKISNSTKKIYYYHKPDKYKSSWERPGLHTLVLKVFNDLEEIELEQYNYNYLKTHGCLKHHVQISKWTELYEKYPFFIMNQWDGDLRKVVHNTTLQESFNLIIYLLKHFYIVKKYCNLIYTDIKLGNVLYKHNKNNMINIGICDLASYEIEGSIGIATYPPPLFINKKMNDKPKPKEFVKFCKLDGIK